MEPTQPKSNFLERASLLTTRGIPVAPIPAGTKACQLPGWPDLATTNQNIIDTWAIQFPDGNAAAVCRYKHCVLDPDKPGLIERIERETGRKLPATFTVRSGGRGLPHKYFNQTTASRAVGNISGEDFDFQHTNKYVVGPGSRLANGGSYEVIDHSPIVDIPDWLVEWLAAQKRRTSTASNAPDAAAFARLKYAYMQNLDPKDLLGIPGLEILSDQHPTFVSLGGLLHDGERTEDDIAAILKDVWDEYCDRDFGTSPGEGKDELERIAKHAVKGDPVDLEPWNMASYSFQSWVFKTEEAMNEWLAEWTKDWRSVFHTYHEFCNAPPVKFAIAGFLQEAGITLIGGVPGHGKTFIMLSMAKALLSGTPLFGHAAFEVSTPSQRVVYLCPEVGMGPFSHRLKLFGLSEYVRSGKLLFRTLSSTAEVPLTDPRMLEAVKGADLVLGYRGALHGR